MNDVEVKTKIPQSIANTIQMLIERGYFTSLADFARQAIIDKIIVDFELGLKELESDMFEDG